jgi:hypothetical protein
MMYTSVDRSDILESKTQKKSQNDLTCAKRSDISRVAQGGGREIIRHKIPKFVRLTGHHEAKQ